MKKLTGRSVFTGRNIEAKFNEGIIIDVKELSSSEHLPFISPGFMDIQVNGYSGLDYSSDNLQGSDVVKITAMLAAAGTSRHFPTIITNSQKLIIRNLKTISRTIIDNPDLSDAIPGIHVEGPFISAEDGPRGAHDLQYVRKPDFAEFEEWQSASGGRIRQLTIAPELPGALDFIKRVSSEGVIVSIGHTAADPGIIKEAVKAGASMSTHLGNGSHGTLPRLNNYIWEQLGSDELNASFIADGFHLPPSVVKVILRTKGLDRLILVSDIAVLGGTKPGIYKWGNIDVKVHEDGHLGLAGTEYLAGSGHLLNYSIAWLMNELRLSPADAVALCTINPQKLFFPSDDKTGLKPGASADLTLFNWNRGDTQLGILETWSRGKKVYTAP
ncbi:MAG: amidohydrolase family protein [Spirochaetia bacterium]|jgi:N-acetylglucosamine-6-phosphate deacetylase|nr:amidohydrolase family protein [Spirochaetia bacterium]